MCGIAGIIGFDDIDPFLVRDMTNALAHRGPNSDGFFRNAVAMVGARRLSIIDVDHGDQPILNEDGTMAIAFNGEIYNYRELREHLSHRGHRFKTRTDTEVVLHLYEEYEEHCVDHLRGMFAFAIVTSGRVYLARDRYGIKPLYLAAHPSRDLLLFASEINALLRCGELTISPNLAMLADRSVMGHATGDQTPFHEISRLRPGHYMIVEPTLGGLSRSAHRYFTPAVAEETGLTVTAATETLKAALEDSSRRHFHADVPVGATLSGGLDSSLLAYLMTRQQAASVPTFTVACRGDNPDLLAARIVATDLHCDHHEVIPSFKDYLSGIPRYMCASAVSDSLHGLPFFLLCKTVSAYTKVCLNGEGADEILGGYLQYLTPKATLKALQDKLTRAKRSGLPLSDRCLEMCAELTSSRTFSTYLHSLLLLYQQDQLEHNHLSLIDHTSMAFGVEMRLPFLDDSFAGLANAIPPSLKVSQDVSANKYILKRIALSYGATVLHDPVLRMKEGLPAAGLTFHRQFEDMCNAGISDECARNHEYGALLCEVDQYGQTTTKWKLPLFDMFMDIFVRGRGVVSSTFSFDDVLAEYSVNSPRRGATPVAASI